MTCQLRLCYEPAMIGMKQRKTLSDVARGKDILKKADFLVVQIRAGMRDDHFLFHCT